MDIDVFGDTAVIHARYSQIANYDAVNLSHGYRLTDIWRRGNGKWQGGARPPPPLPDPQLAGVVVEAAAGLAAEQAGLDHAVEQRGGDRGGGAELLVQRLADREQSVEPDRVGEGERAHRVRAALDHAAVDVLLRREARLVHADGAEDVGDEQGVDDEAGAVLRVDRGLAQRRLGELVGAVDGLLGGHDRAHDL